MWLKVPPSRFIPPIHGGLSLIPYGCQPLKCEVSKEYFARHLKVQLCYKDVVKRLFIA
jgi:hypothetical protein